jgi:hypothetical protein
VRNYCVNNKLNSLISVSLLITTILFTCFLLNQSVDMANVKAASTWTQTTDLDFNKGELNNVSIEGQGINGELKLELYGEWINKSPQNNPEGRASHAMTPIYGTDKVLLFGGANYVGYLNDTWIFDYSDNNWTNKKPLNAPSGRHSHSMASVYGTDKVVLFGGHTATPYANDTWIYDLSNNTWTLKFPAAVPGNRYGHELATIYGTDKVLLLGDSGKSDRYDTKFQLH